MNDKIIINTVSNTAAEGDRVEPQAKAVDKDWLTLNLLEDMAATLGLVGTITPGTCAMATVDSGTSGNGAAVTSVTKNATTGKYEILVDPEDLTAFDNADDVNGKWLGFLYDTGLSTIVGSRIGMDAPYERLLTSDDVTAAQTASAGEATDLVLVWFDAADGGVTFYFTGIAKKTEKVEVVIVEPTA